MSSIFEQELAFKKDLRKSLSIDDYYSFKLRKLMPFKIQKLLVIASFYETFLLEEDGRLADLLNQYFKERDFGYIPVIYQITTEAEALELLKTDNFDLVIRILRFGELSALEFGKELKTTHPAIPYIILTYDSPELEKLLEAEGHQYVDRFFLWKGDGRILSGIIQYVEDLKNTDIDINEMLVPVILLVEDNIHYYSTYIPLLYEELWHQTNRLLEENLTFSQRIFRQKGRPRIRLASTFEEALSHFYKYKDHLIGIFTDIQFPRFGKMNNTAGLDFVEIIRKEMLDIPIVMQSSDLNQMEIARQYRASFIHKHSSTLLEDCRRIMIRYFGFGDLVFKNDNQQEIARISNMYAFNSTVSSLPAESLWMYTKKGILKRWLLARTELELADIIEKEIRLKEHNPLEFRKSLSNCLVDYEAHRNKGSIVNYNRMLQKEKWHFCRLGSGSLGGKARGLAFIDKVLALNMIPNEFQDISIQIPRTLVIGTDYFDDFISRNKLDKIALQENSKIRIVNAFQEAELPTMMLGDLRDFIRQVSVPLAVRSSSLLEDALYHPFAGIYNTKMLPNNEMSPDKRFITLCNAIKLIYASTFFPEARAYIESVNHRIEEEKMAVIIQEVVGTEKNNRFYPEISGVGRSYNYYPFGAATPEQGVVNLALGLGKIVVSGERSLQFSPYYPRIYPQFSDTKTMLSQSQSYFYGINLAPSVYHANADEDEFLVQSTLQDAEMDGSLDFIASTYSYDNDRLQDGINFKGPRVINFAGILKHQFIPLSKLLIYLLDLCEKAMGTPVEIEFAITLHPNQPIKAEFGFLQVRPIASKDEMVNIDLTEDKKEGALSYCSHVLGNGIVEGIRYIMVVKKENFDASKTKLIAEEIGQLNMIMKNKSQQYILIGPGRWGSSDPWLGIPVRWDQINFVKVLIETSFPGMDVDPSQGSHFFQNITSLKIGYFSVQITQKDTIDWDAINQQTVIQDLHYVKLVEIKKPLTIKMNGRKGEGIILFNK
ncbi:histidine kinase [bacterium]|nr:histidine kinase [bacterium]